MVLISPSKNNSMTNTFLDNEVMLASVKEPMNLT